MFHSVHATIVAYTLISQVFIYSESNNYSSNIANHRSDLPGIDRYLSRASTGCPMLVTWCHYTSLSLYMSINIHVRTCVFEEICKCQEKKWVIISREHQCNTEVMILQSMFYP